MQSWFAFSTIRLKLLCIATSPNHHPRCNQPAWGGRGEREGGPRDGGEKKRVGGKVRANDEGIPLVVTEVHLIGPIGVAYFEAQDESPEDAIKRADVALYSAKENGRNRVAYENVLGAGKAA